jgi:hypothetical protein
LPVKFQGIRITLGQAGVNRFAMRVQPTSAGSPRVPVGTGFASKVTPHGTTGHPQLASDPAQRVSLALTLVDLFKSLDAPLALFALRLLSRRFGDGYTDRFRRRLMVSQADAGFGDLSRRETGREMRRRLGGLKCRADDHELPLEQTLDHLAQILQ